MPSTPRSTKRTVKRANPDQLEAATAPAAAAAPALPEKAATRLPERREVTVIGIDPGSRYTGWGIVRETSGVLQLVDCGVCAPPASEAFANRLAAIYRGLCAVLARCTPDEAAIEQVFTAHNAATALKLGQARGVAVAACAAHNLSVSDYEPTLVKKTLVGTGRAEKDQVSFMVGRLLGVKPDWSADTGDALSIAICHLTLRRFNMLKTLSRAD